ncbi:MAG: hypothetical protein ACI9F2_000329 [Lysobacterales bacterium]|jgi:uncharacterized protein YaiI (UPF0178 family)
MVHIFVDADSCPVKNEIYKVATRCGCKVTLVANSWMRVPDDITIHLEVVCDDFDAADDFIEEKVQANDIVITSDILLADRCLKKDAKVIGATGKSFTPDNIADAVATRSLMADLRESGDLLGGPPPFQKNDRSRFLQELNEVIEYIKRNN